MTQDEINTLENKAFRQECEILNWRMFRDRVESFLEMKTTFSSNSEYEYNILKEEIEKIKYL